MIPLKWRRTKDIRRHVVIVLNHVKSVTGGVWGGLRDWDGVGWVLGARMGRGGGRMFMVLLTGPH